MCARQVGSVRKDDVGFNDCDGIFVSGEKGTEDREERTVRIPRVVDRQVLNPSDERREASEEVCHALQLEKPFRSALGEKQPSKRT